MGVLSTLLGGIFGLFCGLIAWMAGGSLAGIAAVYVTAAFGLFALLMATALLSGRGGRDEGAIAAELLALGEDGHGIPCTGNHSI